MFTFRAALVAAAVLCGASTPARAADPLRLEDAFRRTLDTHPDLLALRHAGDVLAAERERAAQRPGFDLGASAENLLGTGAASGVGGAEITLSLASVIERGDKRAARIAVADRRIDSLALLREGKRLDLLAEVARRYLAVVAAQAEEAIARDETQRRERIVEAATQRVRAGGAPASVQFTATAAASRARGAAERAGRAGQMARRRLALAWGETDADFAQVEGDLVQLPDVPEYADLVQRLAQTPELRQFAHETRLREARLQLARSARTPDLRWDVGVRRLQAESDWGLAGSVSLPLGSAARARPDILAAEAELAAVDLERAGQARALEATLAEAWGALDAAVRTARWLDETLLPQLQEADTAAERAYRAGALGYLDWAQLQTDTADARRERLDASLAAHRAFIELQRLTGEAFVPAGGATDGTTP